VQTSEVNPRTPPPHRVALRSPKTAASRRRGHGGKQPVCITTTTTTSSTSRTISLLDLTNHLPTQPPPTAPPPLRLHHHRLYLPDRAPSRPSRQTCLPACTAELHLSPANANALRAPDRPPRRSEHIYAGSCSTPADFWRRIRCRFRCRWRRWRWREWSGRHGRSGVVLGLWDSWLCCWVWGGILEEEEEEEGVED
jgi:hypothetical protein